MLLRDVPDKWKTEEMCRKAVEKYSWVLRDVPDQWKTEEMCLKAVEEDPELLCDIPDTFITSLLNGVPTFPTCPMLISEISKVFSTRQMCS